MTCKHWNIETFVYEDTKEPCGLWACVACKRRFEPLPEVDPRIEQLRAEEDDAAVDAAMQPEITRGRAA